MDWTQFQSTEGDYPDRVKFTVPGDTLAGIITDIPEPVEFADGTRAPKLVVQATTAVSEGVDVGPGEYDVLLSQAQLRAKVAGHAPKVGDSIAMRFTGVENRGMGKTLKLFDVHHKPGESAPAAPPTPAEAPSADSLI